MDLNLFDAFTGTEKVDHVDAVPQDSVLFSRKRGHGEISSDDDDEYEPTMKALKTDDAENLPTFTNATSVVSEGKNVTTFSAYPPGWGHYEEIGFPTNLAKQYKFELDAFQRKAIGFIEKGESVLVAAHTSAGKTAVAEYAIAKSLRDGQRVIYTSPIKALSNQKYRDMQEEFNDVGLMTGDITINPSATCLIMTTEILRSMLYRGNEIMREVAWVIYDEIHYMRDKERGIVWEESIVLLPHKVRFVFLSATIPNSKQFAGWIAKIHHQPCHVVYTDFRPVPLQHYIFPSGGDGLYLVVDEQGKFRDDNFQRAVSSVQQTSEEGSFHKKKKIKGQQTSSDLYRIVKMIMEKKFEPAIIFSFSKRDCEAYAAQMSKLDFNDNEEKQLVEEIFNNAIDSLSEDDKALPQIVGILPLLKRGVGIHHGGLLPLLKEIIEILFQESLLKCLFATETFSIGINMPARTVVFTECQKYDGNDFRWITSGEYIQMSGRAGRRGKDERGIVIQMLNEKMEPAVAKSILYGDPDPLYSSYHVSYNMLLNMLRVEGVEPEFMLRCSFHQYQQEQTIPALETDANQFEEQATAIVLEDEDEVADYFQLNQQLDKTKQDIKSYIQRPEYCLPFLQPGRLIRIVDTDKDFGWGVIINMRNISKPSITDPKVTTSYLIDVLIRCKFLNNSKMSVETSTNVEFFPCKDNDRSGNISIVSFPLTALDTLSSLRIYLPKDLKSTTSKESVFRSLEETKKRFPSDQLPNLDPVGEIGIESDDFILLLEKMDSLESRKEKMSSIHNSLERDAKLQVYAQKAELLSKARILRKVIRANQNVVMKDELKRMKRVLRKLGHTNHDYVIQVKGRTACEINTADELLVTELMFNGILNDLSPEQCAALLSCLIYKEKKREGTQENLRDELAAPLRQLEEAAKHIWGVFIACNVPNVQPDGYIQAYNPELMEVVYQWCHGAKFVDICKMTTEFEGSIIRAIRRLDELLRQLASASFAIGNFELRDKFQQASIKMKRDIVFAASLYL